jgi:capreomycidine synthase
MINAQALLETWMRQYYFDTEIDIGSSGVQSFSLIELRELLGLTHAEMDDVIFDDSKTLGGQGLRTAIAQRYGDGDPETVIATHGSSEAIYLMMNALVNEGDEVLVLDPIYQQFYSIGESLGARFKPWPLRFEQRFAPDIAEAKSLITPNTRLVVVNFPHNPTGMSVTAQEQRELIDAVAEVGAYLIWDGAFAELTYDHERLPDPSMLYRRSISMGTLSKAYGLPGLRVGWCIAPAEVLERCVHLRDYLTLHLSPLVELIAQRAIEKADALLDIRRRQAKVNLEIVAKWANENEETVEWMPPQGGVCSFPRLRRVDDVNAFCHHLAGRYKVLLVPGNCFNRPEHVRLGFGAATAELTEGLSRLSEALTAHR